MAKPKVLSHQRFRELMPILAYGSEHSLFFGEDETLSFGFHCVPLSGGDDSLAQRINVILNLEWPLRSALQFALFCSPDIEDKLAAIEGLRWQCRDKLLMQGIESRVSFLRNATSDTFDEQTDTRVRDIQLVITGKVPIKGSKPTAKEYKRAGDLRRALGQGLASAGLQPSPLTADSYTRVMQVILNWGDDAGWRDLIVPECDKTHLIRDQLLDIGKKVAVDEKGLVLENKHVSLLSVKRYPDSAYFGMARGFLTDIMHGARGIRQNCLITGTVHFPDSQKLRSNLTQKRQFTANQAFGPLAKFVPILSKKQHGFDVLFDALEDGDRPIEFYLGMSLFSDTEEEATAAVANAKSFWRDQGFQLMEDSFFCLPLFLNQLPLCTDLECTKDLFRYKTFATRHAIPMLPLFGAWRGTKTATMNYISRDGQLMNFCPFDSETNYNLILAATSGAGKSFAINDLAWSILSTGGQMWIFDQGKSYLDICNLLEGTFIEFSETSGICLNPFELVEVWEQEADMLSDLVSVMASQGGSLTDLQRTEIKRALRQLWDEKGRSTQLNDVAALLESNDVAEVANVGKQLFPFTSKGEYGRFFNGRNNVDITNRFVVLEMDELAGRKHLQLCVVLSLFWQIQQTMYLGDRNRKKLCLVDEAWAMITGDGNAQVASVLAGFARKARKFNGSLCVITQSLFDMYQNDVGRAIVENAANMILMKQKAATVEELRAGKKLPLNDHEYDLLRTVDTKVGVYSDAYIMTDTGQGIGRLVVEDFKKVLYSTKGEEFEAIRVRVDIAGMSTYEAVNDYLMETGKLDGHCQFRTADLIQKRNMLKAQRKQARLQEKASGAA